MTSHLIMRAPLIFAGYSFGATYPGTNESYVCTCMADESLEEEKPKPGRACEGSRRDLIKCLMESDCVKVVRGVVGGWSLFYVSLYIVGPA